MGSETMSKTRLLQSIKSLKRDDVAALLEAYPELKQVKDERGRNALHSLCSLPSADETRERSLELAQYLLGLGFEAGTDNDYSVTQNADGEQFDVYFRFTDSDPFATSIQCPLEETTGCTGPLDSVPADGSFTLLPGVLHAYKVPAADLATYVSPDPPHHP
jgi:hypothetical protein